MKIVLSIIFNAILLMTLAFFMSGNEGVKAGVKLCDGCSVFSTDAIITYLVAGAILGILNVTVKPIIKILGFPLYFLTFGAFFIVTNLIILLILNYIIEFLEIPGIVYKIESGLDFFFAVAIFSLFNMIYSILFFKKG